MESVGAQKRALPVTMVFSFDISLLGSKSWSEIPSISSPLAASENQRPPHNGSGCLTAPEVGQNGLCAAAQSPV